MRAAALFCLVVAAGACSKQRRSHSHHEPPQSVAPPPIASAPDAGVVLVVYPAEFDRLLGVGADALYFAVAEDPDRGTMTLIRRPAGGSDLVLTRSSDGGLAVDDDAVYWTESATESGGRGGVWRATAPGWVGERIAVASPVGVWLAVNSSHLFFAEGHWLVAVAKQGGTPKRLIDNQTEISEMVADDTAVYWVSSKRWTPPGWLKRLSLDGKETASLLAEIPKGPYTLLQTKAQLYFSQDSRPGRIVMAVPKQGGEATVVTDGDWGLMTVAEDGVYLLPDPHAHQRLPLALHRVRSPGANPEVLYTPPPGFKLRGLMAARGHVYVGQLPSKPQAPRP